MTQELSQRAIFALLLNSLLLGALFGFIYELLLLKRRIFGFKGVLQILITCFDDLSFFVLWAVFSCILLYVGSSGIVRADSIVCQLAGFCVFRKVIRKIANGPLGRFFIRVKKIFGKIKIKGSAKK